MARRGAAVGPYKFTAKQVEPIKAERRKKMRKLQSHPPTKREEAKRQNASGRPLSPGARAYADRQAKEGKPITHKGGGKKLSPQRRQQIRERELADMYLSRRRLAKQPASPKPLPKGVSGPVLPKAKPGKPTVSDRPALHRIKALARQDARDKAKARKTTFLGTVPVAGAITNQMRKELEGSGALGAVFGGLSKAMREQTAAITGPDTPGGIPGTKGVAKVIGNAAADLFEMPAQAAPSIYMPAKAVAKDIAHGKHGKGSESRKFVDDYLKTSATALAVQGKGKEAKKAAGEHPLFTLMELRGIKGGIGRGAGAGMRAIPGKPRQLASTKRAPLKVHGNITVPRRYSKDVLTKGATVMGEKVKRKRGIDPDQASPKRIVRELKRRTDEEVAAVEGTRRANRDRIIKEWEGKNEPHPAAPLAAQGMARRPDTLYKDLAAYRNHLKRLDKSDFSKAEKAANRQLVQQIEKALKKQIDPQEVFAQAEKFKKQQAPLMGELVRKSDLEPAQVRMAPLIPYARSHMGAKWDAKGKLTPAAEKHRAAQAEVKNAEVSLRKAQRQHEAARRKSAYAHGSARDPVTKAEGELLRADHRYRKAQNKLRTASQNLSRAKRMVKATESGEVKTRYGRTLTKIGDAEKFEKWSARVPDLEKQYGAARENLKGVRSSVVAEDAQRRVARQHDPEYKGGRPGYEGLDRVVYESRVAAREAKAVATDPKYSPAAQRRAWSAHRRAKIAEAEAIDELRALGYKVPPRGSERVFEAGRTPRGKVTQLDNKRAGEAGARGELLAAKKTLKIAKKTAREARVPKAAQKPLPALVDADGKRVTAGQIEAHMKANGVKRPAFISQKPNFRGAQNYYLNSQTPKHKVAGKSRTGEATYKGTFDADPKVMSEQLVRQRGLIDAIDGFDTTIKTFGTRPAKNKYFKSFDEAKRFAEENRRDHDGNLLADNVELVPVRIAPFAANKATLGKIKDGLESDAGVDALHDMGAAIEKANGMVDAALQPGPGPVVLMPKVVMNRLRQHNEVASGTTGKAVGAVSSTFKKTVLPVSPKWLTGNIVDPSVRLAMEGATPLDAIMARRVVKKLRKTNPKAAQALEVRALGGLHLSSVKKNAKHRESSQFKDTAMETPANVIGTARRAPVIKQVVNGYDTYAGAVFKGNSKLERGFQYAAMGKELRRQVQDTTGLWHKSIGLGSKALEDLAKGLLDTDSQVAMGRSIDRVLGKWDKNGPVARRALIDYAPFGQWWRAASTYVLVTFPKDHPVKLGVLASLENMTEVERKKLGLTKRGGGVPGFLQGSIPTDKGLVPFGSYSSFGFFNDYPSNTAGMLWPWLPVNELRGINWQGNKLRNKDGSDLTEQQRISIAAYSLIESVVPMVAMGRRLQEGGGSSTDFSTILSPKVKPGTKGDISDAANRIFNPFRVAGSPKGKQKTTGYDWSQVNLDPKLTGSFDWSKVVIK